ncbi:unnamed protein product [Phyllotreta striolata]|uniref:Uncharacterized protein n=1 Tax=Phyllotreta striolata TaxID=444603 RepID=A0A9N9TGU4_PHYSR|nr:unnamed protein product [Phyllotreta striolata]
MGVIDGTYQLVKNDKYVELLTKQGVPEEQAKQADSLKSTLRVKVDGKKIVLNIDDTVRKVENVLVVGETVEEKVFGDAVGLSTTTLEGNTVKVRSVDKEGKATAIDRTYNFSESGLEVVIETKAQKCTRSYKRI